MVESLRIYRRLTGAKIRSQLQYRASFSLNVLSSFAGTLLDFLAIAVIFSHLPRLQGWSMAEVSFLYGISGVAFGITDLVIGHFDRFGQMIRMGEFDLVLVRPMGSLFQIVSADFQLRRIGKIVQAGAVLTGAIVALDLTWTPDKIGLLLLTIACAIVIFASVWTIGIAICFWTSETTEMNNAVTYGGNYLTSYPIEIYGVWLRRILAIGIPMAFVNYYPALYLLDRADPFDGPYFLRFLSPLAALGLATAAALVWRVAVRHYRSTGT